MSTQATLEGDVIDIECEVAFLSHIQRHILYVLFRDAPRGRYPLDLERALRLAWSAIAPELEHLVGAGYVRVKILERGTRYHAAPFKRYLVPYLVAE
ncbi:MAG: hypothetical protein ACXV2B_04495 [Halobacteriota archaeon]